MPGDDMIHRRARGALTTVLADIIIPPENFLLIQFHNCVGFADHLRQPDDRRARHRGADGTNVAAPVQDKRRFVFHDQAERTPYITDVDRFKIGIQNQYRRTQIESHKPFQFLRESGEKTTFQTHERNYSTSLSVI